MNEQTTAEPGLRPSGDMLTAHLLALLKGWSAYGYELAQRLEEAGFGDLNKGSIYRLLRQMERSGLVTRDHVRQHIQNSAPYYFGSRFGQNWWRLQMPGWGGTPMEEVAGPIVEALDPNFIATSWEKMRIAPPAPPVAAEPAAVTP